MSEVVKHVTSRSGRRREDDTLVLLACHTGNLGTLSDLIPCLHHNHHKLIDESKGLGLRVRLLGLAVTETSATVARALLFSSLY